MYIPTCLVSTVRDIPNEYFLSGVLAISTDYRLIQFARVRNIAY